MSINKSEMLTLSQSIDTSDKKYWVKYSLHLLYSYTYTFWRSFYVIFFLIWLSGLCVVNHNYSQFSMRTNLNACMINWKRLLNKWPKRNNPTKVRYTLCLLEILLKSRASYLARMTMCLCLFLGYRRYMDSFHWYLQTRSKRRQ